MNMTTNFTYFFIQVVIDNGFVEVTFASPGGDVIGIKYNEINNVLEIENEENNRGYAHIISFYFSMEVVYFCFTFYLLFFYL